MTRSLLKTCSTWTTRTVVCKGYGDSECEARLSKQGWRFHIQGKGSKAQPILATQERRDHRIAETRARIECVFAGRAQMGCKALRSIGPARATLHLNRKVAAYNLQRLVYLKAGEAFRRPWCLWAGEIEDCGLKKVRGTAQIRHCRARYAVGPSLLIESAVIRGSLSHGAARSPMRKARACGAVAR